MVRAREPQACACGSDYLLQLSDGTLWWVATRGLTGNDEPKLERFVLMAAFAPRRALQRGLERWRTWTVARWLELARARRLLGGAEPRRRCRLGAQGRADPCRSAASEPLLDVVIAVDPARRREGIGGKLLEALIAHARAVGPACVSP